MKPRRVTSSDESGKRQAIIDASRRMKMWLAVEVETLARQYHGCLQIGKPPRLSKAAIERVRREMAAHGHADV